MSKKKKKQIGRQGQRSPSSARKFWWLAALAAVLVLGGVAIALMTTEEHKGAQPLKGRASTASTAKAGNLESNVSEPKDVEKGAPELQTMNVATAVMVTVELDFGPKIPSIAEALAEVERRYVPDDGYGRTFAILDAYGEPTPDGKLHMSMHVSSEKPGLGALIFRRTGEILWRSRIKSPNNQPAPSKNLLISLSDGVGNSRLLDGSGGASSILDTRVRDLGMPVREFWPDGSEREATFIYSACGCPVKVMARRVGERTIRTKELPVIFPDDPAAVATIARLMRW